MRFLPARPRAGSAVLRFAPALRVTHPASSLSRRRESETVHENPDAGDRPVAGKAWAARGMRLRPSLAGEGYRSGFGSLYA